MENRKKNSRPVTLKKKPQEPVIETKKKTVNPKPSDSGYIICIGASAGGFNALLEVVAQLPVNLNAAVVIVLHLAKSSIGDVFAERIKKNTKLPCRIAKHNEAIKMGNIYMAPPDCHMMVKPGKIVIGHGPPENRFRPSIDVLFRSVAASYAERSIGVILTGFLTDGTAGMWAIKQCGGQTIVQDPNEAEFPDMPLSVLETMEVDYSLLLSKLPATLVEITSKPFPPHVEPPPELTAEATLSEKSATHLEEVGALGEHTVFACPDCGGGLWSVRNGRVKHYRCHIGHSYSEQDLVTKQLESIEQTLWVSVRMMEERRTLLLKLSKKNSEKGLKLLSGTYFEQIKSLETHIQKLKDLLFSVHHD
jgi:two-component system, chemotaxis family, protein-glutamate methylesterase/glutaminase